MDRPSQAELQALAARLQEHTRWLCGFPDRSWRRPEVLRAVARYVEAFWQGLGLRVVRQAVPDLGPDYVNLLALPPGRPEGGIRTLLLAHYDTVEGTPGADDNASAVAVLLETARLADRGLPDAAFAAVTLEEPPFFDTPRQGSWLLAKRLQALGSPLQRVYVLEMVGCYDTRPGSQEYPFPVNLLGYPDRGDFIGLIANRKSRHLLEPLADSIRATGLSVHTLWVPGKGRLIPPVRFSDHAVFWDLGYPALMITDTAFYRNPRYHGPDDTPDTLDYRSMARLTLGLARCVSAGRSR